jgi:hypothetical protein
MLLEFVYTEYIDFRTIVPQEIKLVDVSFDLLRFGLRYDVEDLILYVLRFILTRIVKIETVAMLLN